MSGHQIEAQALEAAKLDAHQALAVYDGALDWMRRPDAVMKGPLATEVWAFDRTLTHVLLVNHRWRGWVAPGGKVDPGETPRQAARRELFEETGVQAELNATPAAATVRSYHPTWSATAGISYLAVVDQRTQLTSESGQPTAWHRLDEPWQGWFSDDRLRMKQCALWLGEGIKDP
ncbi:NUDIX hydrolase [Streptomyces cyaneochromogenes]|nr:NUDIX domain-containing protein [Streptomyces cyaneochromogenes]